MWTPPGIQTIAHHSVDQDRSLVTRPHGARGLFIRSAVWSAVVFVASITYVWFTDTGWLRTTCQLVLSWWVGWTMLHGYRRATNYRDGWLDGRSAMVFSMKEAMHRGLSMEDWLVGEFERDLMVLGLQLAPDQGPEED